MEVLNTGQRSDSETTISHYLAMFLLAILVVASTMQGYKIYRLIDYNRVIADPASIRDHNDEPKEVQFARAWFLEKQGRYQQALAAYNTIENSGSLDFRRRVRYNMATIYLKKAAEHWNNQGVWDYKEVVTMVGLADDAYRKVLRSDSENWDARYNLEYSLRINPPPKEVEKADWHGRKSSVFAILPGIPRGGP